MLHWSSCFGWMASLKSFKVDSQLRAWLCEWKRTDSQCAIPRIWNKMMGDALSGLLPLWKWRLLLLWGLLLLLIVICIDPAVITGGNPWHEGQVTSSMLMESLTDLDAMFFMFSLPQGRDKLHRDSLYVRFDCKDSDDKSTTLAMLLIVLQSRCLE